MKLPPEDLTPPESSLKTIEVGGLKTVEVREIDRVEHQTVRLPERTTHSYLKEDIGSRITLGTVVRAREGGAAAAREQKDREYAPKLVEAYERGKFIGARAAVLVVGAGFALTWGAMKWGVVAWNFVRHSAAWVWQHLPWR